ncbi:MAG: hypothetical protein ABIP27_18005 [Flavobacterium circumlabens]|uniref:hypothetical protein n=1 Tax=Flavobacterium circumlabens TaxID=2133765 RepID=UPI00326568B7
MIEHNNTLTAYCFLAALTETKSDLYQGVYIPIIKRALSLYNLQGKEYGKDIDIQEMLKELYGIDVPIIVIRQLLKAVETGMSKKEIGNSGFSTLENGKSFKIEKYTFLDLEEKYKIGQRNAKGIQSAFERYILDQQIEDENIPTFAEFLSKNRIKLTAFFKGEPIINGDYFDKSFINHIAFLETIEQNYHRLYKIAESLYLGSIVASLFECEFDFGAKFLTDEIYYLDTQIVLKALDLQAEADTRPIKELLHLIKESGASIKILDITLGEISYILENAINNFNSSNATSTVNEACIRNGKNKTWLIGFNGKLEKKLHEQLDAKIETIQPALIDKFKKTSDIKELKVSRWKQANAEHDVFAYLFIREKRGGSIKVHQKAKNWFLTANKNLLSFNIIKANVGNVPEVTLPDTLTALLWLKNPNKNISEIKSIGLHELISNTLNDEIASKELINEFDLNLKSIENINVEDYQILISSVAYQSAKYIDKINNLMNQGKTEEFNFEAQKLVEKERKRRSTNQETIRKSIKISREKIEENKSLKSSLKNLEEQIKISSNDTQTEIEKLAEIVKKQENYIKKFIIYLIITLIILALIYLNINLTILIDKAKSLFTIILGLSGLWSFGSFIINFLKSIGKIK